MLSISDMVKILDQIPIWKTLKALPGRLDALEKRIAELESAAANPETVPGQLCNACGARGLRRTSRKPTTGHFDVLGRMDEEWTCSDCGEVERRFNVR